MITTWFSRIYNFPQIGNVNEMKVVALKNFAKVAGKNRKSQKSLRPATL